MSDERWDAIWEGAFETLRRLFEGDQRPSCSKVSVSEPSEEWATVLELVPPLEDEDEPEGDES